MGCAPNSEVSIRTPYPILEQYLLAITLQAPPTVSDLSNTLGSSGAIKPKVHIKETGSHLFDPFKLRLNTFHNEVPIPQCESPVCLLQIMHQGSQTTFTYATCTLISPIFALTSASSVYKRQSKTLAKSKVVFYDKQQTKVVVKQTMIPEAFKQGSAQQDYALLFLEKPLALQGYFGLGSVSFPLQLEQLFVNVLSFDQVKLGIDVRFYMKMKGRRGLLNEADFSRGLATNSLSTGQGAVGAALFAIEGRLPYLVGVQIRKDETTNQWFCCLLTRQRVQQLQAWAKQLVTRQQQQQILKKIDFEELELAMHIE